MNRGINLDKEEVIVLLSKRIKQAEEFIDSTADLEERKAFHRIWERLVEKKNAVELSEKSYYWLPLD